MQPQDGARRLVAAALAFPLSATALLADGVTVQLQGPHIQNVTSGGTTVHDYQLMTGVSEGAVSFEDSGGMAIGAADDLSLDSYFARVSVSTPWTIELDGWRNVNGDAADFFLFEVGGNDSIEVAARLPGGAWGQMVPISGWTSTGYTVTSGPNAGQTVYGLAFASTQLAKPNGSPLGPDDVVTAIRIDAAGIDGASFSAVDPEPVTPGDGDGSVTVVGTPRLWQPMELWFSGPWTHENATSPNPFLDFRLNVTFFGPGGSERTVPGFFAGDGEGDATGNVWKARFAPPAEGSWTARASFRSGTDVAVSLDVNAGQPAAPLDGASVQLDVGPLPSEPDGLLRHGTLTHVDRHYRKFEGGPFYVKAGVNSPENFLAYRGFDGVSDAGGLGILHDYPSHTADWRPGDPYFTSDVHGQDSRGIIGAINYLSSAGVNSIFMMLMNLGGDSQDVHPFVSPENSPFAKTHYDLGRMHQWNVVFEHMARKGIALHYGLAETESPNETWLDGGELGVERKLFYREMVARFAHNPAIKWMLSEENDYSVPKLRDFADYIHAQDAYGHAVTFHNHPNDFSDYNQVYGEDRFDASSMQYDPDQAGEQVEELREESAAAGHPLVAEMDENNPWQSGLTDSNHDDLRKRVLWDVLLSGGGIEFYMGWHQLPLGGDLTLEDFRTREDMWRLMRFARTFVEENLPFWEMEPADQLLSGESSNYGGGEVFVKEGEVYAVYLPRATSTGTLDLSAASGDLELRWFNPRSGSFEGGVQTVQGGAPLSLGPPPSSSSEDWVALIEADETRPRNDFVADVPQLSVGQGGVQNLYLRAGPEHAGRTYIVLGSRSGTTPPWSLAGLEVPLRYDRYTAITMRHFNKGILQRTFGTLDAQGRANAKIVLPPGYYAGMAGTTFHHAYVLLTPSLDYASKAVSLRLVP